MRPLKLYVKTTLLASAVTVLVLAVAWALIGVRVARVVQEKEKNLARVQAASLAEHFMAWGVPHNTPAWQTAVQRALYNNPGLAAVRVWERADERNYRPFAATDDVTKAPILLASVRAELARNHAAEYFAAQLEGVEGARFYAYAPLHNEFGQVEGAVEIIQRLDSPASLAWSYAQSEAWLALAAVILITIGTYALYRYFVYRPLGHLLTAMQSARDGVLTVRAPLQSEDEMGQLAGRFNAMLTQLEAMTKERAAQQASLQERVQEATSELRERNEQLADANLEVWRTSRQLSEVSRLAAAGQTAAQFAHEVGTPLNLISGHVQLLEASYERGEAGEAQQRLGIVQEQIERIERIVMGMLDRTRLDSDTTAALDICAVLRRTLDAAAPLLVSRKVTLNSELGNDLPPLAGDADHLQQVFLNLINNALDAMPAGGALRVTARWEAARREIVVEFADTGHGMTPEVRARIFDPLYTTKERGRGTGLGLSIVRQLVQEHGGRVEVESAPEQGTKAQVFLPAESGQ